MAWSERCRHERGTGAQAGVVGASKGVRCCGVVGPLSLKGALTRSLFVCTPYPARRHHLSEAVAALQRYEAAAGSQLEVACEELRGAARSLGRVTGAVDTEEVLGRIFEEFCIGK